MWHRYFTRFCGRFFYSAIRVRGTERIPAQGPVLWLGLHRNGAVDGFVYATALRRPLVFMISTQLRRSFLARLFFNGIAVARTNDEGDRTANRAALAACVALLRRGGELFVFPEGTSALGPRHLPFKAGAAQLVLDWLDAGNPAADLRVIPVGIHYSWPWAFRSAVEVVVGNPIDLALPEGMAALGRLRELKRRMSVGLETVGANFADAATQAEAEALATLAAHAGVASRFPVLKAAEREALPACRIPWRELEAAAVACAVRRYRGVPLWTAQRSDDGGACGELLMIGPLVALGIAFNAPPWLAATWASRKFPDDRNVIALWKILVGVPAGALWLAAVVAVLSLRGMWLMLGIYVLLSWIAWAGYDRAKRRAVQVSNAARPRVGARPCFEATIAALARAFPHAAES